MSDAGERVERFILRQFREENPQSHLANCPGLTVEDAETRYAMWYDTGVDATELTATLKCPHETCEYEYGELGDLPGILEQLDEPYLPRWKRP